MKPVFRITISTVLITLLIFSACKKNKSCERCREGNKAPTAIAGPDQQITLPTDSIFLDGSASNDSDGKINTWLWKKIERPASFSIASAANSKTVVKNLLSGVYRFELNVTDDKGASANDTVMITVNAASNLPPVANAGSDTSITLPANTANLDGSKSKDPDNNLSSFQWTKIDGPLSYAIINANTVTTQVNTLVEGVYKFELKVTDSGKLSAKDTVLIIVNNTSVCATFWVAVGNPYDTTLNLPVNTARLTASIETLSNRPAQLTISSIEWTKIIGPNNYSIQSPGALSTVINNLSDGLYAFQCKITDISGCSRTSYGGGVINVTDTSTAGQEIIIPKQTWAAEWYPYVKINLKDHMPLGKSIKKVFTRLDCEADFIQVTPSFEFGGNTINLYAHLPFTNSCITENTKVDVKIIY